MSRIPATQALEAALADLEALENQVLTLEETLKELKAQRKQLGEGDLPELVDEEMLTHGVVFADGREFTFEREVHCGIRSDQKLTALEWLTAHKSDAMYKRRVVISFPKDSANAVTHFKRLLAQVLPSYEIGLRVGTAPLPLVDAIQTLLSNAELNATVEEEVELPGATLTAFVKKSIKSGVTLPECFGVYAPLRAVPVQKEIVP